MKYTLNFTQFGKDFTEEEMRSAYRFGDFVIPRKEYHYLCMKYSYVNAGRKLKGLSRWLRKTKAGPSWTMEMFIEKRFEIENKENKPRGVII